MICKTKQQAERVANFGADKMDAQGYTFQHTVAGLYLVTKPNQKPYIVDTHTEAIEMFGGKNCTCAFAEANREFQICKHSVFVERKIDEARIAQLETEQEEWEAWGRPMALAGKF